MVVVVILIIILIIITLLSSCFFFLLQIIHDLVHATVKSIPFITVPFITKTIPPKLVSYTDIP